MPICLANGKDDAVEEGVPYKLPATGTYVVDILANTVSDGPFGPFRMTPKIE